MAENAASRAARKHRIQHMVEASAESDNEVGPSPLTPGEKLESLLHLAAHLPAKYTEDLQYPPFHRRIAR